jgi:hypothetical protein
MLLRIHCMGRDKKFCDSTLHHSGDSCLSHLTLSNLTLPYHTVLALSDSNEKVLTVGTDVLNGYSFTRVTPSCKCQVHSMPVTEIRPLQK